MKEKIHPIIKEILYTISSMSKKPIPRTKCPKLRAWGKPTRKVMTMVIASAKDKLKERARIKSAGDERQGLKGEIDEK